MAHFKSSKHTYKLEITKQQAARQQHISLTLPFVATGLQPRLRQARAIVSECPPPNPSSSSLAVPDSPPDSSSPAPLIQHGLGKIIPEQV